MTYHLASLRLRSIGERSARFTDLTLDMTAPGGPAAMSDVPSDSIVWLRNGGGKSSLLSLFYALLLPHANDFMGRAVKRSLTDYVDSGDTSHTIAVWHPADSPTLLGDPERVLVTGAIYEWTELRRPADPDKDRDRLTASYFAFFAVPGVIDAKTLPLTGDDGQPLRRAAVLAALRDHAAEHGAAMELTLPRNQREWTEQLQARGIDPELFRRQKEMNHVEGGVEDLFRFASAREFIDFLLDLTVPPDDVTPVAERLGKIADTLALRPARTRERDFCREAAITLERIGSAQQDLTSSAAELTAASAEAARLAATFVATIDAVDQTVAGLDDQRAAIQQILDDARARSSQAADLEHLYRHHAAVLRLEEARAGLDDVTAAADRATEITQAWRLTQALAEQVQLERQLAQVRQEASTEREETAPLRRARDQRAAALLARLTSLAGHAQADAEDARTAMAGHAQRADERRTAADQAREEVSAATSDEATARTHLSALENELAGAVDAGLLPAVDADPRAEHERRQQQRRSAETELGKVRTRHGEHRGRLRVLANRLQELGTERTSADGERARTAGDLTLLQERARQLASNQRIRDLAEATADAPVDVWAELPALVRRLTTEVRNADQELIRLQATRLDEERSLDAQSRTGLLPTSLDAARVLAALTAHEIPAEPGWTHLRSNWSGARLAAALTGPELARLGCGVVVPTARVHDADAVLTSLGTVTTSLVGVYSAQVADDLVGRGDVAIEGGHQPAWTGLHRGLMETAAAESAAAAIRARLASDDTARDETLTQRDADRGLIDALDALDRDAPAGHLAALERRVAEFDAALEQFDASADRARAEVAEIEQAELADVTRERELIDLLADLRESLHRLEVLADRAAEAPGWRELLAGATQRRLSAQREADGHSNLEREAHQAVLSAEQRVSEAAARAEDLRSEAARVPFLEADAGDGGADADPAVPLDSLRELFGQADAAYQRRVSASVLAERERGLTQRLSAVQQDVARAADAVRRRAAELLQTPEAQSEASRRRAVEAAERERTLAVTAIGTAQSQIDAAERAVGALIARRVLPKRALPAHVPTPQEADDAAGEHAREAETAQATERESLQQITGLELQATRLDARRQTFGVLTDGLPEPAGEVPAEPFGGDDGEAWQAKREVVEVLATAQNRHHQAESSFTTAIGAVRTVGARFANVTTPARDRVVNDGPEVLAQSAGELAVALGLRARMIDEELAAIAADQLIVTTSLGHLVSDTFDTLRKAERYSRLPASLGPWAGKQMMRIAFETPVGDSELNAHIDRVIDECIAEGIKPQGLPLLKRAVHEAAGPRGFRVKVLKPAQDVSATSEDITRLGKWSGGEKLTVCVAIYCTLAALRARNTGRGNASGGVLMLDNPIGRASHGSLVKLQRDVAAAHGVQLIYTTGVKDPDAISRFPNVIRLDNRPGRTRNRRFIVQSEPVPVPAPADAEVQTVTGARVAHEEPQPATEDDDT